MVLFIFLCIFLLNLIINNTFTISIGIVVVMCVITLALPRGITGIILFGFFLSFVIMSLFFGNIEQGLFYGSLIMSFLVLYSLFKR